MNKFFSEIIKSHIVWPCSQMILGYYENKIIKILQDKHGNHKETIKHILDSCNTDYYINNDESFYRNIDALKGNWWIIISNHPSFLDPLILLDALSTILHTHKLIIVSYKRFVDTLHTILLSTDVKDSIELVSSNARDTFKWIERFVINKDNTINQLNNDIFVVYPWALASDENMIFRQSFQKLLNSNLQDSIPVLNVYVESKHYTPSSHLGKALLAVLSFKKEFILHNSLSCLGEYRETAQSEIDRRGYDLKKSTSFYRDNVLPKSNSI